MAVCKQSQSCLQFCAHYHYKKSMKESNSNNQQGVAMNVVACQLDIVWENKPANHAKVRQLLEQAAPPPGSLVVLPEMFASGFSMRPTVITDSRTRETQGFLADLAQTLGIYLVGGLVTDG